MEPFADLKVELKSQRRFTVSTVIFSFPSVLSLFSPLAPVRLPLFLRALPFSLTPLTVFLLLSSRFPLQKTTAAALVLPWRLAEWPFGLARDYCQLTTRANAPTHSKHKMLIINIKRRENKIMVRRSSVRATNETYVSNCITFVL